MVDLLPEMAERVRHQEGAYHACDYHWSGAGNRIAAEILERELRGTIHPVGAPGVR